MNLQNKLQVHSNMAGNIGMGIFGEKKWCTEPWPNRWVESEVTRNSTFLEFFPIFVAVVLSGKEFKNKAVNSWRDNQAVAHITNTQSSTSKWVMHLVQHFVLHFLTFKIIFINKQVPWINN